jgi:hypothetical protein
LRISGHSDANLVVYNTWESRNRPVYLVSGNGSQIYNNNIISIAPGSPYVRSGFTLNMGLPVGGNYWNTWTTPDANGDGFVDNPYRVGDGTDYYPYTTPDGWMMPVSGVVQSDCLEFVPGVIVDMMDGMKRYQTTLSATDGSYSFEVPRSLNKGEVAIVTPLGFRALIPKGGHATVVLDGKPRIQDFTLGCLEATGVCRSMGYWKHQARALLWGKGNPHEDKKDMDVNYPKSIFLHFHENELNSIQVEWVTYVYDPKIGGPRHLRLRDIEETLSLARGQSMLERAKRQYLALLLNLASIKLRTTDVVSVDGKTASQAVQYIADLINDTDQDGDDADLEVAKDIADAINNAQEVAAGTIPDTYDHIAYSRGRAVLGLSVSPNPGHGTRIISFWLAQPGPVSLEVYDVRGRRIATPFKGSLGAGWQKINWNGRTNDGSRMGQGVYFTRLRTASGHTTTKFVGTSR